MFLVCGYLSILFRFLIQIRIIMAPVNVGPQSSFNNRKHLALLCFSGFLDLFGVSIVIPFLPKHLRAVGESYTAIGIVSSIYGLLQFFSSPIVVRLRMVVEIRRSVDNNNSFPQGNLSDRYGRKRILIISLCCTALSYVLMTANFFSFSASIFVVAISRIPPGN